MLATHLPETRADQELLDPEARPSPPATVHLGIDVGSTTVKVVALSPAGALLAGRYVRANGRPRQAVLDTSRDVLAALDGAVPSTVGLSGSGGGPVAAILGCTHINELVAQTRAVGIHHPEARTVIEIGGQDSKLLSVRWREEDRQMVLEDFAMNALCAAGTGSFLDQQAERLGISIDGEFARIALTSTTPARIAGRCTVFAKSDMIHLQQEGTPLADILAGLCLALARNFRSVIGKGKPFVPPILFQGGVAHNQAVVRAFQEVLGLGEGELVIPEHRDLMAALGAAHVAMDRARAGEVSEFRGFLPLERALTERSRQGKRLPPLPAGSPEGDALQSSWIHPATGGATVGATNGARPAGYLGVDVGSISTNVVVIDGANRVLARRYLPTSGQPLEAVKRGLLEVGMEVGGSVDIRASGVTGSGRYLTGHFFGADTVRNEITAQARAAVASDPEVDTVFEIGGQDSKYIRIHNGTVVDFTMNNACAAGTGSFLEEQSDRLGISIRDDFSRLALASGSPPCLGERCTVFMESDLVHHQQGGAAVEDLTAGLAYSIVENYLNRVVNGRKVGRRIAFQGGVAANASVAAAFQAVTGRPVRVPPDHDVTGAIGVAILAREEMEARGADGGVAPRTRFRGFDVGDRGYRTETFICRACPNLCEVKRVDIQDEPPLFHGARCDRFEEAGRTRSAGRDIPDLFALRRDLLLEGWEEPGERRRGRLRMGFPRTLIYHDLFPWWNAFFRELGVDVVLSSETTATVVARTQQRAVAETCFPVKLVFGHVLDLLERDVDAVFLPSILDRETPAAGQKHAHYCPLIPAAGLLASTHVDLGKVRPVHFPLHLSEPSARRRELAVLARQLGMPTGKVMAAARVGEAAQARFEAALVRAGRQVLGELGPEDRAVVLVGRPYNTCDPGVAHDLPRKLRGMGVLPIPVDFLQGGEVDVSDVHDDMFWRSGGEILGVARIIRNDPRLHAIYLTNFHCGPDSFLITYFRRLMGEKPFLELEMDDHTADAGIVTRCEAFFDSVGPGARGAA